jgi:hypothetical protein
MLNKRSPSEHCKGITQMPRAKDRDGVNGGDVGVFGCDDGEINKSPPPPLAKENGVIEGDWNVALGVVGGGVAFTVNNVSLCDNNER